MHFFGIYHSTKGKNGDSGWRFGILRGLPQFFRYMLPFIFGDPYGIQTTGPQNHQAKPLPEL